MHEVEGRVQGIVREYAQKSLAYLRPVEVARGLVAEAPYVLDIVHIGAHLGRGFLTSLEAGVSWHATLSFDCTSGQASMACLQTCGPRTPVLQPAPEELHHGTGSTVACVNNSLIMSILAACPVALCICVMV